MSDAGVSAFGISDGPAHDFDAVEAFVGGELKDFFERKVGEDRADKTQLHFGTPANRKRSLGNSNRKLQSPCEMNQLI